MGTINKITKHLKILRNTQVSPSLRIPQGVQVLVPGFFKKSCTSIRLSRPRSSISALALAFSFALFGISIFSQTAYAASYINVSSGSGGTVRLGSIKPSSTGVSASGSDTLTITTNCSAGYSVYVSGQEGGDTNLTNTNKSITSNNIISASETTIGSTATTLNSNTWGITGDSDNASVSKYVGLPSYADATNTALITTASADVSGDNKSTVYYGAKVDTTLAPGTYSGDVLYTTLVSDKCNNYTVKFNANGGTGEMSNQTIPVGIAINLSENTFTRESYNFLGWATDAKGKTGTAADGIGTEADVEYTDEEEVINLTTSGEEIVLYAIWGESAGTMQSFQCSDLASGATTYLTDARDDQVYPVYRIPTDQTYNGTTAIANIAGKCLMTKDLSLGYVTGGNITKGSQLTLTSDDSNFDSNASNSSYEEFTLTGSQTLRYVNVSTGDGWSSSTSYANMQYTNGPRSGYEGYTSHSYYSWGAAIVACPKGWRLPTANEYANNTSATGTPSAGLAAIVGNSEEGVTSIQSPPWSYALGGYAAGTTWYAQGESVGYWSSTQSSSSYSNLLMIRSNTLNREGAVKRNLRPVRCIADGSSYTIDYSSNSALSGEPSKTTEGSVYDNTNITMPTVGTMFRLGYTFLGWSIDQAATAATYAADSIVAVKDLVNASSASDGDTITLYAVWQYSVADDGNLGVMQNFICNSLSSGHTGTVIDSRDNQSYSIYRIPTDITYRDSDTMANVAGKCIMTEDLALGYVTGGDITRDSDLVLTTADSAAAGTITARTSASNWSTTNSNSNLQYINGPSTADDPYSTASYYTFGAAQKVCPKGWRLPTAAEYADNSAAGTPTTGLAAIVGNDITGFSAVLAPPLNFVLSGYFNAVNSSHWRYQGTRGQHWAGTQQSSSYGYSMILLSPTVYLGNVNKYYGRPVRCIADSVDISGTLQDVSCASLPEGVTSYLQDARDNQFYSVYRWPSSGTAGTDYPTGMSGYCIMTKDIAIGSVTGGSITKGSNLTLTTADSAAAGTITARTSSSNWSTTNTDANVQYVNGTSKVHTGRSYYSYAAAKLVCPKGWSLPTKAQFSNIASFMGGSNSSGSTKIRSAPYNFMYGGFNSSGQINDEQGWYWASTQYSTSMGDTLYITPDGLEGQTRNKYLGRSVRCTATPR